MTIKNAPPLPIEVSNQTVTAPLWTLARYALTVFGGVLVQKGYIDADTLQTIIGAVLAVVPTIWGAILSIRNKQKLITTAEAAPNSVAKVTP